MSEPNSHLLFAYRAAHVGKLSIVAPINVRTLYGALDPRVPLDPLADLKLILAFGLRAEVRASQSYELWPSKIKFPFLTPKLRVSGRFGPIWG